jgi:hypothetical protein
MTKHIRDWLWVAGVAMGIALACWGGVALILHWTDAIANMPT